MELYRQSLWGQRSQGHWSPQSPPTACPGPARAANDPFVRAQEEGDPRITAGRRDLELEVWPCCPTG